MSATENTPLLRHAARRVQHAAALGRHVTRSRLNPLRRTSGAPGLDLTSSLSSSESSSESSASASSSTFLFSSAQISIVDYSAATINHVLVSSANLEFELRRDRPPNSTRWINVAGLCPVAMKTLQESFKLHPLAVEDVFHLPQRIKADHFDNQLYVSMLLPIFRFPNQPGLNVDGLPNLFNGHHSKLHTTTDLKPSELKELMRPDVFLEECSFFLVKDNVVLSIFQNSGRQISDRVMEVLFGAPPPSSHLIPVGSTQISAQLSSTLPLAEFVNSLQQSAQNSRLTILRKSNDPSLLLHALMDVVVDHFFDLTEFYDDQISHIHDCILDFPKLDYTKTLHLMHKEVTMLRRKLQPTEKLLTALKDTSSTTEFISNVSKTYFNDIHDHCLTVLEELLALEQTTTALMDLTFNMISHQTNENMKLLSVVSFVFLPITFVAGVFGMNFEVFPEIHFKMGVLYFWILTIIVAVISIAWSWRLGLFRRN